MRRLLLALGSMMLLSGPVIAQPDSLDRQFDTANAAYAQGQYARAATIYREILDTGHGSGALYYNLGNAYVRLNRLGEAIRYYEKGRRLRPDDPRLQHNLEQARREAGVYPGRLPPRGLDRVVHNWSPLWIFVAGWLLLGSGLAAAVFRARPSGNAIGRHPLVWGPVAGGLLLIVVALGTSYVQSVQERAVVVADRAPLHAAPSADAPSDTTLPEGTMLHIRARRSLWTEVQLGDGTVGWVLVRSLGDV